MERLPFEEDWNNYYEGDAQSLPLDIPIKPVTDWPPYEQLPLGSEEAPNGWSDAKEYWESHISAEGAE